MCEFVEQRPQKLQLGLSTVIGGRVERLLSRGDGRQKPAEMLCVEELVSERMATFPAGRTRAAASRMNQSAVVGKCCWP